MQIYYGSPAHLILIFGALLFAAILYFIFRKSSENVKRTLVLSLMLLNVFQHLFKSLLYPQYWGSGFSSLSTAYNMCALLILLSPVALFLRVNFVRDFVFYVGSVAGIIALIVPYWNIGDSLFDPDVIRFFICHAILFASSILTLLFGLHKASYRRAPLAAVSFFLGIGVILLNDVVCLWLGIYQGLENYSIPEALAIANPIWTFGPPESFSFALDIAKLFSPDYFVDANPTGMPLPVLWYLIPMFIGISVLAFIVFAIVDRKQFVKDVASLRARAMAAKNNQKGSE